MRVDITLRVLGCVVALALTAETATAQASLSGDILRAVVKDIRVYSNDSTGRLLLDPIVRAASGSPLTEHASEVIRALGSVEGASVVTADSARVCRSGHSCTGAGAVFVVGVGAPTLLGDSAHVWVEIHARLPAISADSLARLPVRLRSRAASREFRGGFTAGMWYLKRVEGKWVVVLRKVHIQS